MIRPCDTPAGSVWTDMKGTLTACVKTEEGHFILRGEYSDFVPSPASAFHSKTPSRYYEHTSYIPPEFLT